MALDPGRWLGLVSITGPPPPPPPPPPWNARTRWSPCPLHGEGCSHTIWRAPGHVPARCRLLVRGSLCNDPARPAQWCTLLDRTGHWWRLNMALWSGQSFLHTFPPPFRRSRSASRRRRAPSSQGPGNTPLTLLPGSSANRVLWFHCTSCLHVVGN